ncbi:MAG TPA: hypothetical protein VI431_06870 [Candidatus Acidoferrum sp.]
MSAQLAFAAAFDGNQAVVARAVAGLPGLAIDLQFGSFPTWTQANECARRLNDGLGLSQSQARSLVTDVTLAVQQLILECQSLREIARQLRRQHHPPLASITGIQHQPEPQLAGLLAQLELGITFCQITCTRSDVPKQWLLRKARKVLSNVTSAMGKFQFTMRGIDEINAGINRLQDALDECAPKDGPSGAVSKAGLAPSAKKSVTHS